LEADIRYHNIIIAPPRCKKVMIWPGSLVDLYGKMDVEEGIGLADAERIVELNLGCITEKLLQTSLSALSASTPTSAGNTHSTHAADEAAVSFRSTHRNFRFAFTQVMCSGAFTTYATGLRY
jgi:hypothetical protein